jgi:small GTP-binding protein
MPVDAKVILVGSAGVGKTSIIHRHMTNCFSGRHAPTLGVSYSSCVVDVDSHAINLQIWDTAGAERYRSMMPMYYRKAQIAIVVFSIIDRQTFVDIDMWMKGLSDHAQPDIIRFLVANKLDVVGERTVEAEEGEQKAKQYNAAYHEVSALTAMGIADLFAEVPRVYVGKGLVSPVDTAEGEFELGPDQPVRRKQKKECC